VSRRISLVIIAVLMTASAMASADPFAGKWRMIVAQSRYPTGTCPTSMIIEMRPAGQGIWYRSSSTFKNGAEMRAEYTADYDGKQTIVLSTRGLLLPVSLRRINPRTVEASYTRGMQIVASSRREVSLDGRRMTITTVSKDASGRNVNSVGIYFKDEGFRKQPPRLKQPVRAGARLAPKQSQGTGVR
jgi:hypothetical protein